MSLHGECPEFHAFPCPLPEGRQLRLPSVSEAKIALGSVFQNGFQSSVKSARRAARGGKVSHSTEDPKGKGEKKSSSGSLTGSLI